MLALVPVPKFLNNRHQLKCWTKFRNMKGKRWRELTDSFTYFIAKEMLPMNAVEKPGFKKMLARFDSRYEVPSRHYFSRTSIHTLYDSVRGQVKLELSKACHYSSTTAWPLVKQWFVSVHQLHCPLYKRWMEATVIPPRRPYWREFSRCFRSNTRNVGAGRNKAGVSNYR